MASFIFDLKHAFYAAAGLCVGAISGYLLGLVLYITVICSSVFSTSSTVITLTASAGVYPLLFAILLGAIGFFAGWYMSHAGQQTT